MISMFWTFLLFRRKSGPKTGELIDLVLYHATVLCSARGIVNYNNRGDVVADRPDNYILFV